ncbi:MAG: multiheme c-type cytochrome [Chloroflexota bacterium]
MKPKLPQNHRFLVALLGGLLVGLLSAGLFFRIASAQDGTPTPAPAGAPAEATPSVPPKACSECHPDVQDAWTASPHAHAYDDPEFAGRWESLGEPGECLLCHTTGYQADTGQYADAGVTCKACHGETVEGHPPAAIPVRTDTEFCGTCHTTTLGEWRLTGHAAANVGCKDCHNPHSQKALFENPDEMCVNCHKDDLGEHKNDLHIEKGVTCVECHMLVLPPETPPADGLAPTGHAFTITPATCVSCHTDTLHIGEPLPGYEAGAKAVSAGGTLTSTLPALVAEYTGGAGHASGIAPEQQIQALEAAMASTRLSMLFQGGVIGLVLGGTTAYFLARNLRREQELDLAAEEAAETEPVDEQA